MTDNPGDKRQRYNPNFIRDLARKMADPKRVSYQIKEKPIDIPYWSPYYRPPTGDYTSATGRPYWSNPQRIARAKMIADAMPPGYEMPTWMPDRDTLDVAFDYLATTNVGKPWYEWTDDLADDDPLMGIVAGLPAPEGHGQVVPSVRQVMTEYGITYDDMTRLGVTEEDLLDAYRYDMGVQQANQEAAAQGGEIGTDEWDRLYDELLTKYDNDVLIQWARTNGLDPREVEKMKQNKSLWWQAPATALFRTKGGQMGQQAINLAIGGAGVSSVLGMGPIPGMVAGGAAGSWMGQIAWDEQQRMAEQGDAYTPSAGYKLLMVLNAAFEGLEIGITIPQLWSALIERNRAQSVAEGKDPASMDNVTNAAAELAEMIYDWDWDAIKATGILYYSSLPQTVAYQQAWGEYARGGYQGEAPSVEFKRYQLGTGDPETIQINQLPILSAYQDVKELIAQGYTPREAADITRTRFGFGGEMTDLVAGYLLDPLDLIGPLAKGIGIDIADASGNATLAHAFNVSSGPVEALRNYGALLRTGAGTDARTRIELGNADWMTRYLAGVDKQGNLLPVRKFKLADPRTWFALRPAAIANEVLSTNVTNLSYVLMQKKTVEDMNGAIRGIAGISPEQAARITEDMPWLQAPIGGTLPGALRDFGRTLDTMEAAWNANTPNRNLILRMAKDLDMTPGEFLAQYYRQGEALFQRWADNLQGKPNSESLLAGIQDGSLSYQRVKTLVDGFMKDTPLTADDYRAHLLGALTSHVDKWAADFYQVKPDPAWQQFSHAIKSTQSLLLLGLNPTYAINNVINNRITMAWGMVLGLRGKKQINDFWQRFEVQPARLRAAIGGAAGFDDANTGAAIRGAGQAHGLLAEYVRLYQENRLLGKMQVVTRLAQAEERGASAQAYTAGTQRAWRRLWKRGRGYDVMPHELENALRAIDPSLPALIYAGIDGTMNLDELNALLWEGVQVRTLDRVLPDAAAYLRRAGIDMDEAGIREALEHTGVYSYLQTALNEARTPEQAAHVLRETRSMVADWVDQQFIQHRHEVARRAVEVAQAEGVAGVLDVFDQLYWDLDDFWIRHYEDWEKVHQTAASKDRQERRRLFRQQRANSRAEWARMNDMEDATLRGTLEGLGADDTDITYIDTSLMQRRHVWNEFFDELNRMQDEYFDTDFGNDRTAASNAWAEVQSRLDDLYVRALAAEDAIQVDIDNVFARLLERQGQSVEAGLAWRRGVRAARSRMGKAMREHRQAMLQIPPDEKLIAWRQFIQAEYKPLIHELRTANLEDARRMYGVNMPAGTRERAPLIERKTIQQLWDEVLVPAGIAGRNEWMAILPSLNGARGDGVAPFTEMDIYTTPTLDRWNQIVDSLNRFGEQGRQNTPPPEPPPAPRTERRRPENAATRRVWDAMTDDERYHVTHHDQRTGIPNGRAFLEAVLDTDKNATLPVVVYVDGRGLKWWNEGDGDQRIPHEAGDRVIDAIAVAIRDETPEGYRLHDSGDEFVMRFATQEEAEAAIARVRERIRNSVIEVQYTDGTTRYYRGADIAYGIGEADYANIGQPETIYRAADTDRAARREAGPTERRGEKPAGVEEVTQPDSESYTDLDAEAGANETITPSGEDIIYRIASTYGLYSINNDLTPVRGFTRHVLNIVKKYGGEAGKAIKSWDELIAYVDQHGTAILRRAFETRRRAKEGQGNLPEQPELVQTTVRRFQARQAIGKIWSEQQGDWIAKPDPETMRTLFVEDLYNAFNDGSQDPQVIRDQVDASVTLMDAHAAVWARLNGRQVVDWWNEQLAGFMSKDNAMQLLNAEQASDALQSNAGAFAYRLEDGRILIAALERPDASTIPHELAHLFVQDLPAEDVSQYTRWLMDEYGVEARWDGARKRFVTDRMDNVPGPLGSPMPADEFVNEMFAVGFEKYLAEGKAPSAGLRGVFQKFKAWLLQIYRNLNTGKMRRIKLSDTMRDVYARMLATGDDLPQKPAYWHNAPTSPTFALGADPNNRYDFNLRVVSLDDLIASHTDTLAENPDFPAELQPRQRDRAASEVQINNIIAQFVPDDLLIDFHVLERGPMIIGSDLIVESGNGRAIALRKMQSSHPAKWYAYQTALARRVQELGLSTEGIPNPVLVRERASTVNRIEFANEANNQSTMTASALEVARNDARLVTDEALINLVIQPDQNIDQAIRSRENVQFVKDFVADLPKNQQSTIMAAGGELSAEGLQRIKNAIIARVFTGEAGERITRVFLESPEVEIKNIQNAVYGALPALARMDGQLKLGTRDADLAITNDLAAAVDMYARLRAQGTSVKNYLQNIGLFETELTEFQRMLLRYLDANARSTNRIRNLITGYAELVMMQPDPNQMDLFGDVRLTKGELLDVAARKLGTDTEFASAEDAAPVPGGGGIKVTKDITGNEPSIVPETPRITIPDTRMDDEQLANYARALVRQGDEAIRLALSDEGDEGKARLQAAIDKERGTQEPAQAGNQADTGIEEAKSYIGQFRKLPGGRVGRIVGVLIKDGAHTGYVLSLSDGTFRPYRDMKTTAFIGDDVNNIKQVATPGNANKFPDRLTDRSIIPDGYSYEEAAPIDPGAESLITLGWSRLVHKGEVRKALEAGEDVPPEVLADYPDLDPAQRLARGEEVTLDEAATVTPERAEAAVEPEAPAAVTAEPEPVAEPAKTLRTTSDLSDAEYLELVERAKDWQYLVFHNGGVANKSSLEDWLTANYGVDRYTGHVIGNRLEQIFNPAQWKEGRAEPKLSDYPDLAQQYGKQAEAAAELVTFSVDDIPYDLAVRAHQGTSFEPERRAEAHQRGYVEHMTSVQESMRKLADTPEKMARFKEWMEEYRTGYIERYKAYLHSHSRVVSSWIAGPANFPAARMNKYSDAAHVKMQDLLDWSEKKQRQFYREMRPDTSRISSDDQDAPALIQAKIDKLENDHAKMLATNKIVRKKGLTDDERVAQIVEATGYKETTARKLLVPDFAGRIGFPGYLLTNNSAEIRRLKVRLESIQQNRAAEPGGDLVFEGGRIVENVEENRIQIIFDAKPDEATRTQLKSRGFVWAPSKNAWQRQLNNNGRAAARYLFPEAKPIDVAPAIDETPNMEDASIVIPAIMPDEQTTPEPEQPQPQTHALADPTTQPTFFDQSAEDMPLFSETPMTAEESAFTATEPGAKQPGLLEERPAFTPTSRVLDVTIVGAGVNKRVRLSLDDVAAIRKLADENKGAEVSWRIVSQDGDIQYKVGKDLKDLLPDVPEGQDMLFQRRRRDRVTVEPVTDPNARHGDMRIVGNVYWSEGRERRLIAYLPERYDVGEWRDSQRGRFRIVGLDPQDANYWIIELEGGGFTRFNPGETEANAINAPVGSVDAGNPNPPIAQASAEYARNTINPILDALERNIMTADRQPRSIPGAREMPERTQRMYRTWASKVQGQMSSAKLAATRMGEGYRDAALLNYTRKTNLDSMLEVIFPYQFWYTRTMLNWMGRFLDKPSILTNYYRFRQMQERHKRDGFPTRLEGKIGIPFPFLPEGMGDALYVDPMKQIFPWENFSRPLDKIADEQNTVEKKAVSILGRWAEERTYDPAAVQNALDTKKGELWEAALAEAKQSSELNYDDPLSLVSAVMTPSLPLYWAALALTGQEDKISQLPFTRMVQAMTGLAGVGEPGGVNLEKGIRQTLDMPEVDRWQDYRIDRELANMAADGRITPEEAVEAMVSRQGEVFDLARSRVGTQQGVRWLFSAFLADLYPEGEKTQRQNADEYYQAIEKWTSGDTDAMQKFYDEHPDYEARMAALRDPQERLKSYLISEVWDRWNEADRVTKKAAAEQLGDMFNQAFLDKETRSYDAIDTETLAYWAKMLGGDMIEGTPTVTEGTALHVPPPELRQEVESFYTERDAKFPNIGDWIGVSQGTEMTVPIVDQYYEWRTDWLAEHPDAIPYILGDDNDLTGLPNNIQSVVFKYRSLRQNLYPNIFELQEQYFNIAKGDNAGRKAYRQQYPELEEYWEWRKAYAAQHPEAASYILGEDSLADMIAGGNAYNSKTTPELDEQSMAMFSQELRLALTRKVYANTPLGQGAWKEINFIWKALGEPGGSMASWMSDTVLPAFGR